LLVLINIYEAQQNYVLQKTKSRFAFADDRQVGKPEIKMGCRPTPKDGSPDKSLLVPHFYIRIPLKLCAWKNRRPFFAKGYGGQAEDGF
jgi:hypothetical protein